MRFLICGGTGFVGQALVQELLKQKHDVTILTRQKQTTNLAKADYVNWDGHLSRDLVTQVEKCDVLVNLAGESVMKKRWDAWHKKELSRSRIETTHALVDAIGRAKVRPRKFISASAIGYYGNRGNEILKENMPAGLDFLASLCRKWESMAMGAEKSGVDTVVLRIGVVLGDGGALSEMAKPFRMGLGGALGFANQWVSWIHVNDMVRMIIWAGINPSVRGIYNATSPQTRKMFDFSKDIGAALKKPALLPVPGFLLRLILGERAHVILSSARVMPDRAIKEGFEFSYTDSRVALQDIFSVAEKSEMNQDASGCCHDASEAPLRLRKRNLWIFVLVATLVGSSFFVPAVQPLGENLMMYLGRMWWALLLGLIIGGVIERYVSQDYVIYALARRKKRTILFSVAFGFLMSVCSHGILALAVELHRKGASTAAVIAFLLASPWANLPITFLLLSFFGLKALFFICGAIMIAVTTGLIFQVLEFKGWVESNPLFNQSRSTQTTVKAPQVLNAPRASLMAEMRGVGLGSLRLADMILWWILIGVVIAAVMNTYIPPSFFEKWMGPGFLGLCVTLLAATLIEVCSEGTAPIAFEIYRQTGAFGNAFVFLMAGVVTDYTEIGLIWMKIGKRAAIWLPLISVPQVLLLGIFANLIF